MTTRERAKTRELMTTGDTMDARILDRPSRRTVVRTTGVVGALVGAGALAACDSGTGSDGGGEGDSVSEAPELTIPASEVPVGSGVVVEDTYAVTQPVEGEFHAFSAICTHQGCVVQRFTATEIVCPCHSSMFSATDGSVVGGPAESPLPAATVTVNGEQLTISAG